MNFGEQDVFNCYKVAWHGCIQSHLPASQTLTPNHYYYFLRRVIVLAAPFLVFSSSNWSWLMTQLFQKKDATCLCAGPWVSIGKGLSSYIPLYRELVDEPPSTFIDQHPQTSINLHGVGDGLEHHFSPQTSLHEARLFPFFNILPPFRQHLLHSCRQPQQVKTTKQCWQVLLAFKVAPLIGSKGKKDIENK